MDVNNYNHTKNTTVFKKKITFLICIILYVSCRDKAPKPVASIYHYSAPQYDLVQLNTVPDTISFALSKNTYNTIKSINLFVQNNIEYVSFYDEQSGSVNIYNFQTTQFIKKVKLKKSFHGQKLFKTTAYCKNFDSIFVTNNTSLYLLDSSGSIKKSIQFLDDPPYSWAIFENTNQPVYKKGVLYASVRPYVNETSFKALRKWKILYGFDIRNNHAALYYHLPELYQQNLYGYHLLDYSYCYNNRGNFVFSFPADPVIYETDLENYNASYFGKSKFQDGDIQPLTKDSITKGGINNYLSRDSYGVIYFDAFNKRYIRLANSKETVEGTTGKFRESRFIIFDESLKIIGESNIKAPIAVNTVLFTRDGEIYARIMGRDEYAIHFTRLQYSDLPRNQDTLTKK